VAASYDVVLWGATSSVGVLVAEYLLRHHGVGKDLRWALGGRSLDKLERVRTDLARIDLDAAQLPLLVGDARNRTFLDSMVPQARVVASTVGPYALHGVELVAACARHGIDYCDITGEVVFVRRMID
jgi:short subunit dehydrogenase-like uncharacterized protein